MICTAPERFGPGLGVLPITALRISLCACVVLCLSAAASAGADVTITGIVQDPQQQAVPGATAVLHAAHSDWQQEAVSDRTGRFELRAVPPGEYRITVTLAGFQAAAQDLVVTSGAELDLQFHLSVAPIAESVTVDATPDTATAASSTPSSIVSRDDVRLTPGADRTNGVEAITAYVPGAYMVHDQLHVRGGHQVSWLVDGVPVPNTDIGSTVGPAIDPKDIDYLEAQRGSYAAAVGDRTYAVFNVVPRTGFERNNDAEVVATLGNYSQTNDQISAGGHTTRFGYYASLAANHSTLGLEPPTSSTVLHDSQTGVSGFSTLILNRDVHDQLRLVTSVRGDQYDVPVTPDPDASMIRDRERERDAFANFSWIHTSTNRTLTVSPFFHWNDSHYEGGPDDPLSAHTRRGATYAGGQVSVEQTVRWNRIEAGGYGFRQQDAQIFGLTSKRDAGTGFSASSSPSGGELALFVEDRIAVGSHATLSAGVRQTHFHGQVSEHATSPRVGATLAVRGVVLRGFVGTFYQPPPLTTVSGPLLTFVTEQNVAFTPLYGERDKENQFGISVPIGGWTLDVDRFDTHASNFFDHNPVGNSNVFLPLTIERAYLDGYELSVRSPRHWRRGALHVAYSYQHADGEGAVTGGLTDFEPGEGRFPLDHDQRHTIRIGGNLLLARGLGLATMLYAGSGLPDDDTGAYLGGHYQIDLAVSEQWTPKLALSLNLLNLTDQRPLIDNSITFGGTHYQRPLELYGELHYSFHY